MSAGLAELVAERARLADAHDRAKNQWHVSQPEFLAAVRPVADALAGVAERVLQTAGTPTLEIARSYMWLGDALFDLAQGRHVPFAPAVAAYRTAEPYVKVTHDPLISAKYDFNLANILLRAESSKAGLEEAVLRYERALPILQANEPAAAVRLEVDLVQARKMLELFQQLEREMQARRAELVEMIRGYTLAGLEPQKLAVVTTLLTELASLENKGDVTQALAVQDRIHDVFQELMKLTEPQQAGPRGRISAALMKLWSELTAVALTSTVEPEVRNQAFAVQQALLFAKFALTNAAEADCPRVFGGQVLPAAIEARGLLARHHLTWVTPIWPVAEVPPTLGIYVTESPDRAELAAVARPYGLEPVIDEAGRELAEARFGALRRAAVVIVYVRDAAALPAACYEVGIALVLGKPLVVLAGEGRELPFDIDLHPLSYDGSAESKERLALALERALLLPQRPPDAGSLSGMIEAARLAFTEHPE
ncbi:MAG TPA: hypothetical protein VGQ57_11375, partial [Polyangiaceae bacterium]|nr:hypothetical protein [Polyangiaceae bacterium]